MRFRLTRAPLRRYTAPLLVAVFAGVAAVSEIDPSGDYPHAAQGPGLTIDESFNVQQGVYLVNALRMYGLAVLHPLSVEEVFGSADYLPDHPPLGRVWIGLAHELTRAVFPPADHQTPFVTVCARTAPAGALALLVLLVGVVATHWYGRTGGLIAAVAVVLMPRVFGHAHLASLETFMGLAYTATVLVVAHYWTRRSKLATKTACLSGCVLGLALLTKIQAILLPLPVAVWAVWHWRRRAISPLIVWGVVGVLVFFALWPWLWLHPFDHLVQYLGRTTGRVPLHTWYFGQRWADRNVPWHYPAVMFLTTVPIGLHLLGFVGLASGERPAWKQRREQVVLGCLLFPLVLFSLPGIAVYDGARLFLVVFPLWAMFVGRGGVAALSWLRKRYSLTAAGCLLAVFVMLQAYGLIAYCPCHLSYYNLLTAGLRGAERLGLDVTYWGDSLTRDLLGELTRTVPQGATIGVAPVLHQFQLDAMLEQSPILRGHGVTLRPFREPKAGAREYVLFFRRQAELPDSLRHLPPQARLLAEVRRQGVQLAALYVFEPRQ